MNPLFFLDELSQEDGTPIFPKVYTPKVHASAIPEGFDAVSIYCNGRTDSALDWREQKSLAKKYVEAGLRIFWEIDLGLFHHLKAPLLDQTQFYSLGLSLKHFRETLWAEFRDQTVGLSLYKGTLAFEDYWIWDQKQVESLQAWLQDIFVEVSIFRKETKIEVSEWVELIPALLNLNGEGKKLLQMFCRNSVVEYVEMLSDQLPADLAICMIFEEGRGLNPLLQARMLAKDRFERIMRVDVSGKIASCIYDENASVGICFPPMNYNIPSQYEGLEDAVKWLEEHGMTFRFVSEPYLTTDWHRLDYLLVVPNGITPLTMRKLKGFCAAGGVVVVIGELSASFGELADVISFSDWKEKQGGNSNFQDRENGFRH
jgi:hypothetical protein